MILARVGAFCVARRDEADAGGPEERGPRWGSDLATGRRSATQGGGSKGASAEARPLRSPLNPPLRSLLQSNPRTLTSGQLRSCGASRKTRHLRQWIMDRRTKTSRRSRRIPNPHALWKCVAPQAQARATGAASLRLVACLRQSLRRLPGKLATSWISPASASRTSRAACLFHHEARAQPANPTDRPPERPAA